MPSYFSRLIVSFFLAISAPCWCGTRWIFEPNVGQTDTVVVFLGRAGSSVAYITPSEVVFAVRGGQDAVRLRFLGAAKRPVVEGADSLPGKSNYFTSAGTRTGIAQFGRVRYRNLYPDIDLVLYGNEENLEYDFEVSPGADPRAIAFRFEGAKGLTLDGNGDLLIATEAGQVRQRKPHVYQELGKRKKQVSCDYVLKDSGKVRLKLGRYDPNAPLVIDPVLTFSTLMGSQGDRGQAVTVDSEGNAYVVGTTASTDFPTTPDAFSRIIRKREGGCAVVTLPWECSDVFVAKFSPRGDLLYSTYIGGTHVDWGYGIAVDSSGNAFVTGATKSRDFPVTSGVFQGAFRDAICSHDPSIGPPVSFPCDDAFVLKLNSNGSALVYSTYLTYLGGSGSDTGRAATLDASGNVTVVGRTAPKDSPSPKPDASPPGTFITKLNATGSALMYSSFLVGATPSAAVADPFGNVYIAGTTNSVDFPYTPGAYLGPTAGPRDAFLAKFSGGGEVIYIARIGSADLSFGLGLAVDSEGSAYVTGATQSDFPVTVDPSSYRSFPGTDIFLTKLDPHGSSQVYSVRIGGREGDYGVAVALDGEKNAYVLGLSRSADFPVSPGAIRSCGLEFAYGRPAVLLKIDATGGDLLYSTYLNTPFPSSLAVDSAGNPWMTGSGAFVGKVDFSRDLEQQVTCVANAASLREGPISPGELVAIFGAGLGPETPSSLTLDSNVRVSTELAGVRVLFNGTPAPLLYVQTNQINAIVPYGVSGEVSKLEVEYLGVKLPPVTLPVASASPAVFTLDMSGAGQAVILNEDGTINTPSNPAPEGSIITLWATGAGLMVPALADGQVIEGPDSRPQLGVRVQIINGPDPQITYAGAAPGMFAGVLQVDMKIAPGTKESTGTLRLFVGETWSPYVEFSVE